MKTRTQIIVVCLAVACIAAMIGGASWAQYRQATQVDRWERAFMQRLREVHYPRQLEALREAERLGY